MVVDLPTLFVMQIAVVDPLPMYRQGLLTVLAAAGFAVDTPADLLTWARRGHSGLILLTLASSADWELMGRLRANVPWHQVIAVLPETSAGLGARAVRAGARSVLPRDVTAAVLRRTVEATIDGQTVIPVAVADILVAGSAQAGNNDPVITADHVAWLGHLRSGTTVAELARLVGYSERAMYRLLRQLYQQLGARTRVEAIVRAQQQGLL